MPTLRSVDQRPGDRDTAGSPDHRPSKPSARRSGCGPSRPCADREWWPGTNSLACASEDSGGCLIQSGLIGVQDRPEIDLPVAFISVTGITTLAPSRSALS